MFTLEIPGWEYFNNETGEFITEKPRTLHLEHSLISLTKWEQHYKRPYLSKKTGPQNLEENIYYFYCMTIEKNTPLYVYQRITQEQLNDLVNYINDPMTATTITQRRRKGGRNQRPIIYTSEVIYSYMAEFNLPFDICEKWHLNHLLTLIQVCSTNNAPVEKMSNDAIWKQYKSINEANKARFHTKG